MLEELRAMFLRRLMPVQKMIANREQILVSAQKESDTIIDNAKSLQINL